MGHDGEDFDDLASDLTVLFLDVGLHHGEEELDGVVVVGEEVLAGGFGESAHGRDDRLLGEGAGVLQNLEEFLQKRLQVGLQGGVAHPLHKVSQTGRGVRHYSRNRVFQQFRHALQGFLVVQFLNLGVHVIRNLSDAVTHGVTDSRVGVIVIFQHHVHNRFHLFHFLDVFSHLGQSHDGGIGVTPVGIAHKFLDNDP